MLKLNHKLFLLIIAQFIVNIWLGSLYSMDASTTWNSVRNILNNSQRISQTLCTLAVYSWNKLSSKDIAKQPITNHIGSNKIKVDLKILKEEFPSAYQQFLLIDKYLNRDVNAIIEKSIQPQVINGGTKPLLIPDMPAAVQDVTLPKLQEVDHIVIDLIEFQKLIRQGDTGLLEITKVNELPNYKIPAFDNKFKIPEFHQKLQVGQSQFGARIYTTQPKLSNQNIYLSENEILEVKEYIKSVIDLIDILKQSNSADLATRLSKRMELVEIGLNIQDDQKNIIRSLNYIYEHYFQKDGTIKFDVINQTELETSIKILFHDPNLTNLIIWFTPEYYNLIPIDHYTYNIFFAPSSYKNFAYKIRDNNVYHNLKTIQLHFSDGEMSLACNTAYACKFKESKLFLDALVKQKFKFNAEGIILEGQNDPRWIKLSPQQKQNIKKDPVAFYNLNFDLYYRSLLKEYFKEKFKITKSSAVIDRIIYQVIDNPLNDKMYMGALFNISKNVPKNSPVYKAFYNENGVLKCYENHPLYQTFKLNTNLPPNIQYKVIITINRLLGFEYAKNKNIIDQSFGYIKHAIDIIDESPAFLDLVNGICEALDGNKPYAILLKEKNFLAANDKKERIDSIAEAFNKIEEARKKLLLKTKEKASIKEKNKSNVYNQTSGPNPSLDPNDPDKDKKDKSEGRPSIHPDDLNENKFCEKEKRHIFSKDHKKMGIYDLANNKQESLAKIEILRKISRIIKNTNTRKLLKPGLNQIRTLINGHKVEIKVFMENGKINDSIDAFKGWSIRNFGNVINLLESKL